MNSKRFGFVLLPEFALLPLSCMVDTLEDANYVSERRLYDWCSLSVEGTDAAVDRDSHAGWVGSLCS